MDGEVSQFNLISSTTFTIMKADNMLVILSMEFQKIRMLEFPSLFPKVFVKCRLAYYETVYRSESLFLRLIFLFQALFTL